MPYVWSLAPASANLPPNLTLGTNGVISGTPLTNGTFYFYVRVTDARATFADQLLALTINAPPLAITTTSLPVGTFGAAYNDSLMATGGQSPYSWSLALGSANLPSGLTLGSSGAISGRPGVTGTFYFIAKVTDASLVSTNRSLAITIYPRPTIVSSTRPSNNTFQFRVNGGAGQNYTIQSSSNLTLWTTVRYTNAPTDSFLVQLTGITNSSSFFRVLVGP